MMKNEVKKNKERLARFEKITQDMSKSLERYLEASKAMYEAEQEFHQDLRKFYTSEDNEEELILGSANDSGLKLIDNTLEERSHIQPLFDAVKGNVDRVNMQYQQIFTTFKKRFNEAATDQERIALDEDLELWEEQKQDPFDDILLILLKIKQIRSKWEPIEINWAAATTFGDTELESILVSCEHVLNDPHCSNFFKTFLAKEFSAENLEFWTETNDFKLLTDVDIIERRAKELYQKYFRAGSERELNVSATDAKRLEELMRTPNRDVFDEVHRSVFYLMKSDSFPRFTRDPLSIRLSKRIKKRDFINYKTVLGMKQRLQVTLDAGAKKDDLLTERDWMLILSGAEVVNFVKGDIILAKDQKPQHFYKIKSGRVKFESSDQELNAIILGEGDIFGELPFFDMAQCYSVVAHDRNISLYRIENKVMSALLQVDMNFSERFFQMLTTKLSYHLHNLPLRAAISKINEQKPSEKDINNTKDDTVSAEAEEKDLKMGEIFMIRTDDVIIKEFHCSVKKKIKLHGTLYIFGKHLGFYSKVFGNVTKIIELLSEISSIETVGNKKLVVRTNKKQKYTFYFSGNLDEAYRFIITIWRPNVAAKPSPRSETAVPKPDVEIEEADSLSSKLTARAWESIFEFAKCRNYKKDEVIVKQGELIKRIYQIGNGNCRVELPGDTPIVLGRMGVGDIFGEITFMFGGGATVSIVADDDDVRIYTIDKTSLQSLFSTNPELAGQFYKFLASQIGRRVLPKHLKQEMDMQRRRTRSSSFSKETNQFIAAITNQDDKKVKRRKSVSIKKKEEDHEDRKYTRLNIPTLEIPGAVDYGREADTPRPMTNSNSWNKPSSKSVNTTKPLQKVASNPNLSSTTTGIVNSRKASFSQLSTLKDAEEVPDWMKKLKQKKRQSTSGVFDTNQNV